ncbi:MAG: hypothetical protein J5527_07285 [Treponema sp.]|nr:hypothetical protein [Treponema sp.]
MVVIVLHSTEELKICRLIKELSGFCARGEVIVYKKVPLWIPVDELGEKAGANLADGEIDGYDKAQLKLLAERITNVQLLFPKQDDDEVYCPVIISYNSEDNEQKQITTKLTLLRFLQPVEKDFVSEFLSTNTGTETANLFPMQIKIFRLGNAIKTERNSFELTDFIWRKQNPSLLHYN